jgi:hypothetical protein
MEIDASPELAVMVRGGPVSSAAERFAPGGPMLINRDSINSRDRHFLIFFI